MPDNVAKSPITDNVAEKENGLVKYGGKKYWGQGNYHNVTLHLNPSVWKAVRIMAVKEECYITDMVNEALATWLKWIKKAEEVEEEGEIREATQLLHEMKMRQRLSRARMAKNDKKTRALRSRHDWERIYPGKPWPLAKGLNGDEGGGEK